MECFDDINDSTGHQTAPGNLRKKVGSPKRFSRYNTCEPCGKRSDQKKHGDGREAGAVSYLKKPYEEQAELSWGHPYVDDTTAIDMRSQNGEMV